jgi:integrase
MAILEELKDRPGYYRVRWYEKKVRKSKCFGAYADAVSGLALAQAREKCSIVSPSQLPLLEDGSGDRQAILSLYQKPGPDSELVKSKTFAEAGAEWLKRRHKKKSLKDDEDIIETHLKPFFGSVQIHTITRKSISDFKLFKESTISKKTGRTFAAQTIKNAMSLLRAILNFCAEELEWIKDVPNFRKLMPEIPEAEFSYLKSNQEIESFLEATKAEEFVCQVLYFTAIETGMRLGELAGLRWSSVDLDGRFVTVSRSFGKAGTKSNKVRHVPISDALHGVLVWWKDACKSQELVFPSPRTGTMLKGGNPIWDKTLKRVLVRAGLDESYITFHDLRHTFASTYLRRGGKLSFLQQYLGHSTVKLTLRYAHLEKKDFAADPVMFAVRSEPTKAEAKIDFTPEEKKQELAGPMTFDKPRKVEEFKPGFFRVRWTYWGKTTTRNFRTYEAAKQFADLFDAKYLATDKVA